MKELAGRFCRGGGGGGGCSEASSRRGKQRKPAAGVQQRDWFMINCNYACFWSAATAERRRRADPPAGTTAAALSSLPCSPHLQHQFDHLPPLQRHQVRASNGVDGRRVGPVGGGEEHLHLTSGAALHRGGGRRDGRFGRSGELQALHKWAALAGTCTDCGTTLLVWGRRAMPPGPRQALQCALPARLQPMPATPCPPCCPPAAHLLLGGPAHLFAQPA